MYDAKTKTLLSVAALAGTTLAQSPTVTDPACVASLAKFSDAPTPPPALLSYLGTAFGSATVTAPGQTTALPDITLEDPVGYQELFCSIAAELPESLLPDFGSYASGLLSYGSVHLSDYDAYVTDCVTTGEAASTIISQLHEMLTATGGVCQASATTTPGGSSNGTYPTGTGSLPTPTGSGSATLVPTAAAARPTGAVVGAAAIGGLLGAVAML